MLVDAFSNEPLAGNPCAVVFDADSLGDDEMLKIAQEMNQSETAFVLRTQNADLRARYFTPEREIPLAGHPTIATIHAALENQTLVLPTKALSQGDEVSFSLELNDGPITVKVKPTPHGPLIRMFQRQPVFGELHDPAEVLPLFGLTPEDCLTGAPFQTVSTGTRQLMVPISSLAALKRVTLHPGPYREYRARHDFFSPHFFCLQGISPDAATFARHLGVPPDTMEDAFTGSATGGMAAYLWKHGLTSSPTWIAEQGHWMGRPGRAFVEVLGPREQIESVVVAGQAVTVVAGILTL